MTAAEQITAPAPLRLVTPDTATAAADVVNVPFSRTRRSSLNPRKRFDHDKLVELAASIYQRTKFDGAGNVTRTGIEQNLIGRPSARESGMVELAAGERRQRAVELLVQGLTVQVQTGEDANGRAIMGEAFYQVPDAYPVPFRVEEMTDAELIEVATLENSQRQDMTPMEEADAFLALIGAGRTADYVAVKYGLHVNTVKSRVQLAAGLGRDARKLLDEGAINLEQAKIIATTSGAMKKSLTEHARNGNNVSTLKNLVKAGAFLVENARFDVEASGLKIDEGGLGMLGDFPAKFADHRTALNKQLEALEILKAQEEEGGTWGKVEIVTVESAYANLPSSEWVTPPQGMTHNLTLICSSTTGKVAQSSQYVRYADAQAFKRQQAEAAAAAQAQAAAAGEGEAGSSEDSASTPRPTYPAADTGPKIREAAHVLAHQTRSQAIHGHLATDPRMCLALACESLAKATICRSGSGAMEISLRGVKEVLLTEEGRALAADLARTFNTVFIPDDSGRLIYRNFGFDVQDALTAPEVREGELLKLFAYLTHQQVGNWENNLNDTPRRVKKLAERLDVVKDVQGRFTLSAAYLDGYTVDALLKLIETMPEGLRPVGVMKASKREIVGLILEKAPALKGAGWLPDLVKF
ncbi:ParB/RepB/Spo0J family partition protein [Deinococcus arenicola]|uniref:ParB N-terminal domain-containing protein n=1 Tax=Deinococcus arenicola TaxID=2994950 RepID=A0ABU4DVC6_9DEIO|nr:ParB N-terminal domain-containing protein [Deinococcus sp. ZS9-10]MDV6376333.1 ParB N-terminal domain-containing protein [Deinococcus sp. ZS9-10]